MNQLAGSCPELFNREGIMNDVASISAKLLNSDEVAGGHMATFIGKIAESL